MRTNIEIDDKLMKKARKISGAKTKKAVVEEALQRMVQIHDQGRINDLIGKIDFWDDVVEEVDAHRVQVTPARKAA
jgi:Arc/MetJ family transcription regulator